MALPFLCIFQAIIVELQWLLIHLVVGEINTLCGIEEIGIKPRYLGDSYDIVKRSFLRWLGPCGAWAAHPMFTEHVSIDEAAAFSRLLGVPLLSRDIIKAETDRESYFACARSCPDHLFLDPDTGLRLTVKRAKNAPSYLFGSEIVSIVCERPHLLTLVFDQSLARGREREQLAEKLTFLYNYGIASFAYWSHACFILMGSNKELVWKALKMIQCESGLPTSRFVMNKATLQPAAPDGR